MAKQTITALYDSREYANNAALMLRQAGIADTDVTVSPETAGATSRDATEPHGKGFWASLESMFGDTDDHSTYAEGLRRGGILLTAHVDDAKLDDAISILEQHGSVDLTEREDSWRQEGWSGASAVTGGGVANTGAGPLRSLDPVAEPMSTTERTTTADMRTAAATSATAPATAFASTTATGTARTSATTTGASTTGTVATTDRAAGRGDVLQVVEENLSVGKRAVNRGKVRIHSYVVETPVTETVSLRDETVTIDRRPVDRPLGAADLGANAFQERTVELDEIDEEAVVAKTARVVEEIGLRKEATDRTQTITDTVRSTKVDIDDGRTASGSVTGGQVTGGRAATLFGDAASLERAKDLEVVGSDGAHVGVVDHVQGTSLKLKKDDPAAGGSHHLIPTEWVQDVAQKVRLTLTAAEARSRWTAA